MNSYLNRRQVVKTAGIAATAVFGLPLLGHRRARAAAAYDFVDIGETQSVPPSASTFFYAACLTEDGKVIGTLRISETKNSPYVFSKGKLRRTKTGKHGARFNSMNKDGVISGREITGWTEDGSPIGRPAIWIDDEMELLPYPDGLSSDVTSGSSSGIDDHGNIVGNLILADGSNVPVLWTDKEPTILPNIYGYARTEVRSVTRAGLVGGIGYGGFLDNGQAGDPHPIYWEKDSMFDLPCPVAEFGQLEPLSAGSERSFGGSAWSGSRFEATVWLDGVYTPLPTVPNEYLISVASSVNANGDACGAIAYTDARESYVAMLWQGGEAIELATLVDLEPGVQLLIASDINDAGQIVGGALWPDGSPARVSPQSALMFPARPAFARFTT